MEQTECTETSAYNLRTPGNYPEESKQHSEHGESLKSRRFKLPVVSHPTSFMCCVSQWYPDWTL